MPQYDKLVRDRIPEIIGKAGKQFGTRILSYEEFLSQLDAKLEEEHAEYLKCSERDRQIEELADMLEVIYAIAEAQGVSSSELERIRRNKAEKRGAFKERILLEWVED